MKITFFFFAVVILAGSCAPPPPPNVTAMYLDVAETGLRAGGVRMVPIMDGKYNVWTKRVGNNPKMKVLLLHGGPGLTHEVFESFDSFFPQEGVEYYYYDQLGSFYSDQPSDSNLWTTARFVEEVEEVRKNLGLDSSNFFLLGSSWGGILAMEYALKYQKNLRGLVISNMMASAPEYGKYAEDVLSKQFDPAVLKEIKDLEAKKDFNNPRYMALLMPNFYNQHLCRIPLKDWPDPLNRTMKHINPAVYTLMQGPSEFGISGRLANWDVSKELPKIEVPTLMIGAQFDTMDPDYMKWMAGQVQHGRSLYCPDGSHLSMWDDQTHYFPGLVKFLKDVDTGRFAKD